MAGIIMNYQISTALNRLKISYIRDFKAQVGSGSVKS